MTRNMQATIKLRLEGGDNWYSLCVCRSSDAVGALVEYLCRTDIDGPGEIRIDVLRTCKEDAGPVQ